jgi:hypothetical protein
MAEWVRPDEPDTGSQQIATATIATVAHTTAAPTPVQTAARHSEWLAADGTTLRRAASSARTAGLFRGSQTPPGNRGRRAEPAPPDLIDQEQPAAAGATTTRC